MPLLSDPAIPRPDYIICDVGATLVDGHTLQSVYPLQSEIEATWPGEQVVAARMAEFPGLDRQTVPQQRRCSYFCEPGAVTEEVRLAVEALGCDLLYSADMYLDCLPAGVNKGSTLRRLIEHLQIDEEEVLVAGDTLNDLSMYEQGFKGVCVGESEQALLDATGERAKVLHARLSGCGGILEAFGHFGFLGPRGVSSELPELGIKGKADLVMVYHRLPYEEALEEGKLVRRPHTSPNGILPTLMSFFAGEQKGSWVAWSIHDPRQGRVFEVHTKVDDQRYPNLVAARVALTKEEVDVFYKRFSKEAFWPTLHTFWERAIFREEDWAVFLKVNRLFAERTAAEAAEGAVVWLHDYNLWMVPAFLRPMRPDLTIAFFHHTYFPSADVFNVLPWRRQIIGSLLQCDYVGFHIPRQSENFVDVVRGVAPVEVLETQGCAPRFLTYGCAVGLDNMTRTMAVHGRHIGLGAHPVGLDVGRVKQVIDEPECQAQMQELREQLKGLRVVLSVERLDYTKGILAKLLAFEALLDAHPELIGKVSLLTICVPAAREMTIYETLLSQIEQAVGRINGRFSRVGWTPVQFFYRAFPFRDLIAYYLMADVMWITPLRDGLNLVAKEYVATQGLCQGRGVLVLSEFAGAAAELHGALLTNPHDPHDMRDTLYLGLTLGEAEREARVREMFGVVQHNDIKRWGDEFLQAVRDSRREGEAFLSKS